MRFRYKKLLAKLNFWNYIPIICLAIGVILAANFVVCDFGSASALSTTLTAEGVSSDSATQTDTNVSMSISNITQDSNGESIASANAGRAETYYSEHEVKINGTYISSYNLMISSTGELTYSDKKDNLGNIDNSLLTLTSANNATGTAMANSDKGVWGYSWDSTKTANVANLNYTSPTTGGTLINKPSVTTATGEAIANGVVNDGGKLVFAAHFSPDQPEGNYSTKINLMLTMNPREIVTYTLKYDCKGGTGTACTIKQETKESRADNITFNVPANPTRTGYNFVGWSLNGSSAVNTVEFVRKDNITEKTISALWNPISYACTKQYRLQKADGNWDNWVTDTTESVPFDSTCTYTKSLTNYKAENGANNSPVTTSAPMNNINGITVQVSLYRNTHTLTITKDTYISSFTPASGGTYRWGQSIAINATVSSENEFKEWTQTAGTGMNATTNFTDATKASTTFTMPTSDATIQANGKSKNGVTWNGKCGQDIIDNRDGVERHYTTAQLGNLCWMTSNLNLAGGTTITNDNSNILAATYTLPLSSTVGFGNNKTAHIYNTDRISCTDNNPCYSYYNWITATAGTSPSTGNATSDICPKGWRLPTSDEITTVAAYYMYFNNPLAGNYDANNFVNGGSYAFYWSGTAGGSGTNAYRLRADRITVNNILNTEKRFGFFIRCVAK